ncbi:copper chaperone PCu(A)C [Glutamicibacter arilaitensis]|uniref:copper chaperone PCu(A)C n=1 Tax=Glutamicibacter arilaitensis TaxID=256701 RepID=UPI00384ED97B
MKYFKLTATLAAATTLLLSGCAQEPAPSSQDGSTNQVQRTQAENLRTNETWAKAAEQGMSAAFGVLHNDGEATLELESVTDKIHGTVIEIHDTQGQGTEATMSQHEGALLIKPDEAVSLTPGGTHFMYMDLKTELVASQTSTLQLNFSDGSSADVQFPIRNFSGANESYHGSSEEHDEHEGH